MANKPEERISIEFWFKCDKSLKITKTIFVNERMSRFTKKKNVTNDLTDDLNMWSDLKKSSKIVNTRSTFHLINSWDSGW